MMATPNLLGSNQIVSLERNKVITITKRTVCFSCNVYQTHNITGFSEAEVDVDIEPVSGESFILACLLIAIIGIGNSGLGLFLLCIVVFGYRWGNRRTRKYYGLLLTLNSGDKKLFITTQKESLKRVIGGIYEFIESENEGTYEISISDNYVSEIFMQEDAGGDTSYLSGE
jgi:hypothetical protein